MNSFKFLKLILWSITTLLSCNALLDPPLLINCGLDRSSNSISSLSGLVWQSDDDPAFAPSNINDHSTSTGLNIDSTSDPPFKVARVFLKPVNYIFSIPPGPIFIRLYFSNTISYNNVLSYQFSTSLLANNFTLLRNFNPIRNSLNNQNDSPYEFQIIVPNGKANLNLTFFPGEKIDDGNNNNSVSQNNTFPSYGYVNGIEIRSIPDGLYIKESSLYYTTYVTNLQTGYTIGNDSMAFQTLFRLNVGGQYVARNNDSREGEMMREWNPDDDYMVGFRGGVVQPSTDVGVEYTKKTPAYVAPRIVYETTRVMGNYTPELNLARNLTWKFDVDAGFDYVMRLHFRELDINVTGPLKRMMNVFIGGMIAQEDLDVWSVSGGFGIPMYKDYIITIPGNDDAGGSNGTKVPLLLDLSPQPALVTDVFLNGLEILKLSISRNLAVPNPPYIYNGTATLQPPPNRKGKKTILIIIGSIVGSLLLASVILFALFRRRILYKRLFSSAKSSSKGNWLPTSVQSQSSSGTTKANSSRASLPSDLCRRFSLTEMRVATSDFDENFVIGVGGFGKVYKGCIDGGVTNVAIKRLNPSSKQGEHEFLTEIEMLSRLRHMHLVSLIGYCEEQGEMILVYEYMPKGTLRDHLSYKRVKDMENDEVLSWKQRLMICLGSARGLDYLHAGAKQLIIHRDVKSTNILLDDKWTAKVSDFGLSKVGPASDTGIGHVSTAVKGSFGYLDPEYYRRQQLTEKSDVYSFGVVLFEVLCARQVVNPSLPKEQVNLANWGRSCYKNGTLHTIMDPNLTGQITPECLRKYGEIAEMCVRNHSEERPSMRDVVWSLEFALQLQETAEKNSSNDNVMVEVTSVDGGGIDGGSTDNDVFTNSSIGENIIQSNGGGVDNRRFGSNSGSSATTASIDYQMDIKSGSVFSEILDPRAR